MRIFIANLFSVIYHFQNDIGNRNKPELYTSLSVGILIVLNLMVVFYLLSFIDFKLAILFLRKYYVFTSILIVLITISILLYDKKYKVLLSIANQQDKSVTGKYKMISILYIIVSVLGYALAQYALFDAIYFGEQ
jgi:hypothetical protein